LALEVVSSPLVSVRDPVTVNAPPANVTPFELAMVSDASERDPGTSNPVVRGPDSCK
jgi:hypothetical protein